MALSMSECLPIHSGQLNRPVLLGRFLSRRLSLILALFYLYAVSPCRAQVQSVTDVESTPIPGAGHDYLHMLNETVNPANGSVSVRISVPVPEGRGLTLPFSFAYDSNGAVPINQQTGSNFLGVDVPVFQGGWSYSMPMLGYQSFSLKEPYEGEYTECPIFASYVLYDAQGNRHSLNGDGALFFSRNTEAPCPSTHSSGDDPLVSATFIGGNPYSIHVQDADGTTYTFGSGSGPSVEDRNGNQVQYQFVSGGSGGFSATDTAGRTVISANGFGASGTTVRVSGLANSYALHWGNSTYNYSLGVGSPVYTPTGANCETISLINPNGSSSALSTLTLPNGQSYHFYYDPTYGVLSEIVYPTGGWIKYTWALNSQAEAYAGPAVTGDNQPTFCYYRFSSPVITKRQVSYDGINVAETQTFTNYTTNWGTSGIQLDEWTTKSTTVTSTDNVRNQSFTTTYAYTPVSTPNPPEMLSGLGNEVPVESQVIYKDWSGSTLRTVNKTWLNQYLMASEQTVLPNGTASGITYTYGNLGVVKNKSEYDYGQTQTPTRQTATTYQSFSVNPLGSYVYDRPCQVLVEDGSNNRQSETDYLYDGGTTVCGTAGTSSVAGVSNLTEHDETNYGLSSTAPRGNVTQQTQWASSGTSPVTTYTYDEAGKVLQVVDPCGNSSCSDMTGSTHTTTYSFTDSYSSGTPPGATDTYVTKITNALGQFSTFTWGYADGQLTSAKDPNSQVTNYKYGITPSGCSPDLFDRLGETDYPDGGVTSICYNDSPYNPTNHSPSVTTSRLIVGTTNKVGTTAYDGIGHAIETILSSDPDGTTYTVTTYDGEGKPYQVYNPTRCSTPTTNCGETTWGYTTNTYDALGRTTQVAEPDGSAIATAYLDAAESTTGYFTQVTDEVGNQRLSQTDGLGRLTNVWEAPNTSGYNYPTNYQYDLLNDLTGVTQNGSNSAYARDRSFVYDSLGRLTSASNPESGAIAYTYDASSNLSTKMAPTPNQTGTAQVTTNYTYDELNRLTQKTYTGMTLANSQFGYDGTALTGCGQPPPTISSPTNLVGRRSAMCAGESASSWSFDPMGRPLLESRYNDGSGQNKLNVSYAYFKDGSLNTLTYPSFDVVTYTVGGAGRPTLLSDSANNYVGDGGTTATYAPQGALAGMVNGYVTGSFAGIVTANNYNDRLQPIWLSAAVSGSNPFFSLCYDFHLRVAITQNSPNPCQFNSYATGDNGNVYQVLDYYDSSRSVAYIYDPLNRIAQAYTVNASGNCWGETYASVATAPGVVPSASNSGIDSWGNLTNRTGVTGMGGCQTEGLSKTANTNNQLTGLSYDAAGDVTNDGNGNQPTYDAEDRIATDAGVSYYYDADGFRMQKSSGTLYWPGPDGEILTETDLSGNIKEEYIFFNGERIARVDRPIGAVHYYFSGHLGSTSVVTDSHGNGPTREYYFPYGGIASSAGSDPNHYKFTGKERDTESGLDMFGARYYGSSLGRFMTPDWAAMPKPVPYANFGNPQSLNLYSYTKNNPTTLTDPDGHCDIDVGGGRTEHHWGWCVWHTLGLYQTQPEMHAEAQMWRIILPGIMTKDVSDAELLRTVRLSMAISMGGGLEGEGGALGSANYAQRTFSENFSSAGAFAGKTVDEVASALRSGELKASDVPIQYIVKDGQSLILNTRSAQALETAGIPRSQWYAVNMTGDAAAEARLAGQLQRNNLTNSGTPTAAPEK